MIIRKLALAGALLLGTSVLAGQAFAQVATAPLPDPPKFAAQQTPNFVGISDILEYKALPAYHEPQWVTDQFVKTGKLPPVQDLLPGPDALEELEGRLRPAAGADGDA